MSGGEATLEAVGDAGAPRRDARRSARHLVTGPLVVLALSLLLSRLPERAVELKISVDVRALLLLVSTVLGSALLLAGGGPQEEERPAQVLEPCGDAAEEPEPAPAVLDKDVSALSLPEDLLRELASLHCTPEDLKKLECPVCKGTMLPPMRTSCGHQTGCRRCFWDVRSVKACPECHAAVSFKDLKPDEELIAALGELRASCTACGSAWQGRFADFCRTHVLECPAARGKLAIRHLRSAATDEEAEKRERDTKVVDKLYLDMMGASPVLVHRFGAQAVESAEGQSIAPLFCAFGHLWSLRMGALTGSAGGARYMCLMPHGHSQRLCCSLLFAKRNGHGYRERRVAEWPAELAGHPWGPTIQADELREYVQPDGTLLVMVHAVGLAVEGDQE